MENDSIFTIRNNETAHSTPIELLRVGSDGILTLNIPELMKHCDEIKRKEENK